MLNNATYQYLVKIHRWTGLLMAGFLMLAGLTGSLLAFYHELDEVLNPHFFNTTSEARDNFLPSTELFSIARQYVEPHGGSISTIPLTRQANHGVMFRVSGIPAYDQLFLNPYNGDILGHRRWGDIAQNPGNIMGFIYRLHYSLALPGRLGVLVMGIIALLWTVDHFVALCITLPRSSRRNKAKGFWLRWRKAFRLPWRGGGFTFQLHRAGGLWLWSLLLVFAWSGVGFNLPQVFKPVMSSVLEFNPDFNKLRDRPLTNTRPQLDYPAALQRAKNLSHTVAERYALDLGWEESLRYAPIYGLYRYRIHSNRDISDRLARTEIIFDGDTGALVAVNLPSGQYAGNTITRWIYALHMGTVFGLGYRIIIALLGIFLCFLCYSGVLIWWKKRCSRKARRTAPLASLSHQWELVEK